MSAVGSFVYRNITRRFSTIFLASAVGAYVMNYTLDTATNTYWDQTNKGKQWKDVKATL